MEARKQIISLALFVFFVAGCTSVETDPTSNNRQLYSNTRVDFSPVSRAERDKFLAFEKQVFEKNVAPLQAKLDSVTAARTERYNQIKGQFPDCEKQKHCVSTLARGNVKDFERYNALTKSLQEFDIEAIDHAANIRNWQLRYEIRARSINNRFLAYEILQMPKIDGRIQSITVHSMEAFDSRRPLSMRLLRLADFDIVASTWGDLNFQMLGKGVDEAAVVAAYDIWLVNPDPSKQAKPDRFVVSFLINVQEPDELGYDDGFLRYWAKLLAEPLQLGLREKALCSLYTIAGESLAAKLPAAKAKRCALERTRMQTRVAKTQYVAEDWILPLGYVKLQGKDML